MEQSGDRLCPNELHNILYLLCYSCLLISMKKKTLSFVHGPVASISIIINNSKTKQKN